MEKNKKIKKTPDKDTYSYYDIIDEYKMSTPSTFTIKYRFDINNIIKTYMKDGYMYTIIHKITICQRSQSYKVHLLPRSFLFMLKNILATVEKHKMRRRKKKNIFLYI